MFSRRSVIIGAGAAFITKPALAFPVLLRNPLTFPGGRPGFNPAHVAAPNTQFSGVAIAGGKAVNILNGTVGTVTSTITTTINGLIGPANSIASGGPEYATFTAGASQTNTSTTLASIILGYTTSYSGNPIAIGSASSGPSIQISSSGVATYNQGGGGSSTAQVTLNTTQPWFLAASNYNAVTCNIVATNIQTGQILSSTSGAVTELSHNATVVWGCNNGLSFVGSLGGLLAAAMYSTSYMSMPKLLAWAKAPWDFWYPPTVQNLIMSDLAHLSSPGSTPSTLLMGVGK